MKKNSGPIPSTGNNMPVKNDACESSAKNAIAVFVSVTSPILPTGYFDLNSSIIWSACCSSIPRVLKIGVRIAAGFTELTFELSEENTTNLVLNTKYLPVISISLAYPYFLWGQVQSGAFCKLIKCRFWNAIARYIWNRF